MRQRIGVILAQPEEHMQRQFMHAFMEEAYKKEILKLRIENERLKKNYTVRTNEAGEQEYVRLKPKNSK